VQERLEVRVHALEEQTGQLEDRLREATRSADRLKAQNDKLTRDLPARLQARTLPASILRSAAGRPVHMPADTLVLGPPGRPACFRPSLRAEGGGTPWGQAVEGAYRQQVEAMRQDMLTAQAEQHKQLRSESHSLGEFHGRVA
jgi:hypothetical protein